MRIVVDGLLENVTNGTTVLDLLRQLDEPTSHIIVEINGSFVHPSVYAEVLLRDGDRVEVVYPAFGG